MKLCSSFRKESRLTKKYAAVSRRFAAKNRRVDHSEISKRGRERRGSPQSISVARTRRHHGSFAICFVSLGSVFMQKTGNLSSLILKSIVYSILGGLFVIAMFLIEECFNRSQETTVFPTQTEQSIGLIWILLGLSFSSLFCNLLFRKTAKFFFLKWFFLLLLSTVTSVLMQMTFLINHSTIIENLQTYSTEDIYGTVGIRLFVKLLIALTPFIFLFEGCQVLFANLKKRNAFS